LVNLKENVMRLNLFDNITGEEKEETIAFLIERSTASQIFFVMIVLSAAMATFGLLLDDSAVIIGSMLIAPLLYPVLSCSMGIEMSELDMVKASLRVLLQAVALAVLASTLITLFFFLPGSELTEEVISRTRPILNHSVIAFIAGLASSFALVKPKLNESLPGIAISVALIPPLSVIGIGVARLDWFIISRATVLFLINFMGVVFGNLIVFSLMDFYIKKGVAEETLKAKEEVKEETKLPKEKSF